MEFLFHIANEHVPVGTHLFLLVGRNSKHDNTIARNSVVELARIEVSHAHVELAHFLVNEACEHLDGIGALLVDVVTRVSAHKSFQGNLDKEIASRCSLFREVELRFRRHTACAAHENLSLILRVAVDEHVAAHEASLHSFSSGESGFLIYGEYALDGAVLDVVRVEDSKFDSHSDTIVSTERCALGSQPFAVNIGLNGIFLEVEIEVNQLLAHHVHVALQDDRLAILVSRRSRLADKHIACFVNFGFKSATRTEFLQELNHFLLVLGRTGNLIDALELLEDATRCQFIFVHKWLFYQLIINV